MKADLLTEAFTAARAIRQDHFDRLAQFGIETIGIMRLGQTQPPVGMMNIRPLPKGLWEPNETDGEPALIIPVTVQTDFDVWGLERSTTEFIDLIALSTSTPTAWRWRIGQGWALGEDLILSHEIDPLPVVATPLDWLRAEGQAVCILDWSDTSPAWAALRAGPDMVVPNQYLRAKLASRMRRTLKLPNIWEGKNGRAA